MLLPIAPLPVCCTPPPPPPPPHPSSARRGRWGRSCWERTGLLLEEVQLAARAAGCSSQAGLAAATATHQSNKRTKKKKNRGAGAGQIVPTGGFFRSRCPTKPTVRVTADCCACLTALPAPEQRERWSVQQLTTVCKDRLEETNIAITREDFCQKKLCLLSSM